MQHVPDKMSSMVQPEAIQATCDDIVREFAPQKVCLDRMYTACRETTPTWTC
jgi:hypothetical protein